VRCLLTGRWIKVPARHSTTWITGLMVPHLPSYQEIPESVSFNFNQFNLVELIYWYTGYTYVGLITKS
jgi:hypothetical protein